MPWLTLLWAACIVVGLAWALSFARLIWRPRRSRAARPGAHGAGDLGDALFEALPPGEAVGKTPVQHSFLGRARKSH